MDLGYGFLNNLEIIRIMHALYHNAWIMEKFTDFLIIIHELLGKTRIFTDFSWNWSLFFSNFLKYLLLDIDFIICAIVYYIVSKILQVQIFFSWKIKGQDVFFTEISIYMLFDSDFILTGILYFIINKIFTCTFQLNTERSCPLKNFLLKIRSSL